MDANNILKAAIKIDCQEHIGNLKRIWASIGFDEINWTYTPRGKKLFHTLSKFAETAYYIRNHNALTSSNGLSRPAWGGGNVYHESSDGIPIYHWDFLDQVYDTILEVGFRPFVEFGFLPYDLVPSNLTSSNWNQDVGFESYENEGYWKYPPKDYQRWGELVYQFIIHYIQRYGKEIVQDWLFELWNEPDLLNYWHGTIEDYLHLYDVTVFHATRALPGIKIGGPCTTSPTQSNGQTFLHRFLEHCVSGTNYVTESIGTRLDFISFHTKGAYYCQRRVYNPTGNVMRESPSSTIMMQDIEAGMDIIASFPTLEGLPVYINECDPAVGTIYGVLDNPNFIVTNNEYYPTFIASLVKQILDLTNRYPNPIERITTWAFYFEGKRYFEGNRALITNDDIEKPVLNIFRMFSKLGKSRVKLISQIENHDLKKDHPFLVVDGIATLDDNLISIMLWHQTDEWWQEGSCFVDVLINHIPFSGTATLRHFRIDKDHSNAHSTWIAEGSPQTPSLDQVKKIKSHQTLELLNEPQLIHIESSGKLKFSFQLPLFGTSLLQISPNNNGSKK
jgi:xylan 1,4-beta-xylosidase